MYFKITIFLLERIFLGGGQKANFTELVSLRCAFTFQKRNCSLMEQVERTKKACASYNTYASSTSKARS